MNIYDNIINGLRVGSDRYFDSHNPATGETLGRVAHCSRAQVDMNIVALADGRYVEVQGTAEGLPYDRVMMNKLLDVAQVGLDHLFAEQVKAINR